MSLYQSPIFPLIMTIFTLFVVVIQSIQNEKLLKKRFIIAFLNIALSIVILAGHDKYIEGNDLYENIYTYYAIFVYIFYFGIFISSFKTSTLKANHYQLFVKSIRESKWNAYYVVDKRERIKDISQSLLDEINFEKEDVIGQKLFNIFNKSVRFTSLNNKEINNRQLENYYQDYRKTAEIGDSEVEELIMLNYEGKEVIFKLMMQPVFVFGKYRGRIVVGEKKTDFDLLGVEKNLNSKTQELESIRLKFIATLEISKEGLFYIDLDERYIWASDALVKTLDLVDNSLDIEDFRKLIHPEDLGNYLASIGDLSVTKAQYLLKYRIFYKGAYMWVEERGKRIFEDHYAATIMGSINPVKTRHFRSSNIDVLDELRDYNELLVKMQKLLNDDRYFYVMLIDLANIPNINEEHGWEVGNMLMAQYISQMKNSFVTENGNIYRISGLRFVVLVTDPNKMSIIQNGSKSNSTFLNLEMQYGSIRAELEVFAGIAVSKKDAQVQEYLYKAAEQALTIARNPNYDGQVVFYSDINEKTRY
ncbi:MAG TPA: diguanylate cyclase [Acholeplasmataceae bacterium]|nr:diguanylate cyclase [Acholeplasmataceae bacterium]